MWLNYEITKTAWADYADRRDKKRVNRHENNFLSYQFYV